MTYISWSSDFVLHLEDCLMYEHHTLGLCVSMTLRLTSKINVGLRDLYFMVHWPEVFVPLRALALVSIHPILLTFYTHKKVNPGEIFSY